MAVNSPIPYRRITNDVIRDRFASKQQFANTVKVPYATLESFLAGRLIPTSDFDKIWDKVKVMRPEFRNAPHPMPVAEEHDPLPNPAMHLCQRCEEMKPLAAFRLNSNRPGAGPRKYCRSCESVVRNQQRHAAKADNPVKAAPPVEQPSLFGLSTGLGVMSGPVIASNGLFKQPGSVVVNGPTTPFVGVPTASATVALGMQRTLDQQAIQSRDIALANSKTASDIRDILISLLGGLRKAVDALADIAAKIGSS